MDSTGKNDSGAKVERSSGKLTSRGWIGAAGTGAA